MLIFDKRELPIFERERGLLMVGEGRWLLVVTRHSTFRNVDKRGLLMVSGSELLMVSGTGLLMVDNRASNGQR